MLSVGIMIVMLSAVMPSVVILNVMAPKKPVAYVIKHFTVVINSIVHLCLIFTGKAETYPSGALWRLVY
jgi:hypothetical protein